MKNRVKAPPYYRSVLNYTVPLIIIGLISVFFALSSILYSGKLEKSNFQSRIGNLDNTARLELQLDIAKAMEAATILVNSEALIRWFSGDANPLYRELSLIELDSLMRDNRFDTSFAASRDRGDFYVGSELIETLDVFDPDDSWFYESLYMDRKITLNVDHNRELGKTMLWVNAQVIREGKVTGIAGVGLNINGIQSRLEALISGDRGKILFIDDSGVIKLAYPMELVNRELSDILDDRANRQILLSEDETLRFDMDEIIYSVSRMNDLGLTVVVMAPLSEFLSPTLRMSRFNSLLSIVLIGLMALFFIRIIVRLKNTILYQEKTQNVTILSMSMLAELKDQETGKHITRTKKYCRLLAEELKMLREYSEYLTPGYIKDLEQSAPLHDIGKVGIPDKILLKPGKLTEEEFEVMKTHTTMGAGILRAAMDRIGVSSFLTIGIQLVRHHHEKWDGSGYPDSLAEERIPLSARIMAIADVYDALRTKRPYKEAIDHEKTVEIIRKGSGNHFQPEIVEAFLKRQEEFLRISQDFADDRDGDSGEI